MNRRYIALFVARKDRTWASALFVSLSAVGMALGPLLSLPLSLFPTKHFAGLTFDHVRPSAWLLAAWLCWFDSQQGAACISAAEIVFKSNASVMSHIDSGRPLKISLHYCASVLHHGSVQLAGAIDDV